MSSLVKLFPVTVSWKKIEKFGTKSGKPTEKVKIASCGELTDKHIMSQKELMKMTTYREGGRREQGQGGRQGQACGREQGGRREQACGKQGQGGRRERACGKQEQHGRREHGGQEHEHGGQGHGRGYGWEHGQ